MAWEFKEIAIEALCTRVTSGATPLRSRPDFYEGGTIDWYKTGELNDWFLPSAVERITEKALEQTSVKVLPANTVLMAMYGDGKTITTMGILRSPATTNQACAAMLVDNSKCTPLYFFYALKSRRDLLLKVASGGAQRNLSSKLIKEFMLPVPSVPTQRRIAGILSAYDDLIENCQRRIQILEEMARSLYREWFVNFRFPGHESVPLVPSALGDIPHGWEAVSFDQLLFSMTGGDWGSDTPEDRDTEPVTVIRGTDFDDVAYGGQLRAPVRYIKETSYASRSLRVGDVIIENSINAKSRSVGSTLLVDSYVLNRVGQEAIAASFCKVLRPHTSSLAPLIHLHARHLREIGRMEYYQNVATNGIANFQAKKFAAEEHLKLPQEGTARDRLIEPLISIFQSVSVLASQIANLRQTRDLLLPRLISGQLEVTVD